MEGLSIIANLQKTLYFQTVITLNDASKIRIKIDSIVEQSIESPDGMFVCFCWVFFTNVNHTLI